MTKDSFMKFYANIRKNFYHNQNQFERIKQLYCSKKRVTDVTYTIIILGRVCYTWREAKSTLSSISPLYRIRLSQPFVNRCNDFIYYVSLFKPFNYAEDSFKHSLAWTLFRSIQKAHNETNGKKRKISFRRYA